MGSVTEEVADIEQHQDWPRLFHEIKVASQYNFSCQVSKLNENRRKNRYRDVSPFDHSRVKLNEGANDYINANLVEIKEAGRRYILSQGPLPNTAGQFWQMVWEQQSRGIIMLNKLIEKGMVKCHCYWPVDEEHPLQFPDEGFAVFMRNISETEEFVIREMELFNMKSNDSRTVTHFHFRAWPDFDVPHSPAAFLNFLAHVREYGVLENDCGPAIIHCSAGIGRSGTFILIDACLNYIQQGATFSIRKTLLDMRKYRMGLVQTPQQLRFSYFSIAECERIIMYKQSDEDSFSEGTPSDIDLEDYDFMYNENPEHTSQRNHYLLKGQNDADINRDDPNTLNMNGETADMQVKKDKEIQKGTLNNNIDISHKVETSSPIQHQPLKSADTEDKPEQTPIEQNLSEMQFSDEKSDNTLLNIPQVAGFVSSTFNVNTAATVSQPSNIGDIQTTSDVVISKSVETVQNIQTQERDKLNVELKSFIKVQKEAEANMQSESKTNIQLPNDNTPQQKEVENFDENKEMAPDQMCVSSTVIKNENVKQSEPSYQTHFDQRDVTVTTPNIDTETFGLRQRNLDSAETDEVSQSAKVDTQVSTNDDDRTLTMYILIGFIASILFALMMYTAYNK